MKNITEKEKQYLLDIKPEEFLDKLNSKIILEELFNCDFPINLGDKWETIKKERIFNQITLIGLYSLVLNIIGVNIPEALCVRHNINSYSKEELNLKLFDDTILKFVILPDQDVWLFQDNTQFEVGYSYIINITYDSFPNSDMKFIIKDKLILNRILTINHSFNIPIKEVSKFMSKMLILYEDFVDNIPV